MGRPLGNDTIYIQTPTLVVDDADNTTYYDFEDPTEVEVPFCSVQPFKPSDKLQFEITAERDYARATWRVYAPPTAEVMALEPHDRIRFDGRVYEVYGEVGLWRRLNGVRHHVQIILQTREG